MSIRCQQFVFPFGDQMVSPEGVSTAVDILTKTTLVDAGRRWWSEPSLVNRIRCFVFLLRDLQKQIEALRLLEDTTTIYWSYGVIAMA